MRNPKRMKRPQVIDITDDTYMIVSVFAPDYADMRRLDQTRLEVIHIMSGEAGSVLLEELAARQPISSSQIMHFVYGSDHSVGILIEVVTLRDIDDDYVHGLIAKEIDQAMKRLVMTSTADAPPHDGSPPDTGPEYTYDDARAVDTDLVGAGVGGNVGSPDEIG